MKTRDFRGTSVVVLTGAGISAESGLQTFRDPDGIWAQHDFREIATPEGFAADPVLVHSFYNSQRKQSAVSEPNAAHLALTRLEREWDGPFLLVTQNIDGLHEMAGSQRLAHMHGQLDQALCTKCGARSHWTEDMSTHSICPVCGAAGHLRPDIVWFGEMPYHMPEIYKALGEADLFVAIGTSGTVYPAAGFVREASMAGAFTVEINLESSEGADVYFSRLIGGKASETVPGFVDELLSGQTGIDV